MKKLAYAALFLVFLIGSFLGGTWYKGSAKDKAEKSQGERKVLYYVDPMNPAHTTEVPGMAPCGMPMEPVYADDETSGAGTPPRVLRPGSARITPEKQQIYGIRVEEVQVTPLEHRLRALGKVAPDENRTYRMLASTDGWVWNVNESTTGSVVEKDQLMATVYNYELISKLQLYVSALDYAERSRSARSAPPMQPGESRDLGGNTTMPMESPPSPGAAPTGKTHSVLDRVGITELELRSLGVGDYQLEELARTRQATYDLQLRSPVKGVVLSRSISPSQKFYRGAELFTVADLGRVWVLADVFDSEADYIRPGTKARVSLPNRPRKSFPAEVTEIPPVFDDASRTLKVRLETENPNLDLRPNMFVDVELLLTLPPVVNVPVDAVMDLGQRKTVFVDRGNGFFEPRQVETGWRFGERVEIVEGLAQGERIAVSGNFLINSESRMKLAAAGLSGTPRQDPVCGMEVYDGHAKAAGLTAEESGKTFYFCSEHCKQKFLDDSRRKSSAPPESSDARSDTSSQCPRPVPSQSQSQPQPQAMQCGMMPAQGARSAPAVEAQRAVPESAEQQGGPQSEGGRRD